MANNLTDLQIERWRNLSSEASSDLNWVAYYQEIDSRRRAVKEQIVMLINRYLSEGITIEKGGGCVQSKGNVWSDVSQYPCQVYPRSRGLVRAPKVSSRLTTEL
jgi:hypothetical protein